jgi:hypothetical protein
VDGERTSLCRCLRAVLLAQVLRELFWPWRVQMLDNPTVQRADVAAGLWQKPFAREIMPVIAAQLLAGGYDSPALRAAGDLAARGDPRSIGGTSRGPWWKVAAGSPARGWLCPARRWGAD